MGDRYCLEIEIQGYEEDQFCDILAQLSLQWNFDMREMNDILLNDESHPEFVTVQGEDELPDAMLVGDFAERLAWCVWIANGRYCNVAISSQKLIDEEVHEFTKYDYDGRPMPEKPGIMEIRIPNPMTLAQYRACVNVLLHKYFGVSAEDTGFVGIDRGFECKDSPLKCTRRLGAHYELKEKVPLPPPPPGENNE